MNNEISTLYLGVANLPEGAEKYGIKDSDRAKHMQVMGKAGTGKSIFIENCIIQDMQNGHGLCVIDPHGSLTKRVLGSVPEHRVHDVVNVDLAVFAGQTTDQITVELQKLDFRKLMDEQKIVIVSLATGQVGEMTTSGLGISLIKQIHDAAATRSQLVPADLEACPMFYLYIDEVQRYVSGEVELAFSNLRKYKVSVTIVYQYSDQLKDGLLDGVHANFGTMVVFRPSTSDAEFLEKELNGQVMIADLVNLPNQTMWVRPIINGLIAAPVLLGALPAITL